MPSTSLVWIHWSLLQLHATVIILYYISIRTPPQILMSISGRSFIYAYSHSLLQSGVHKSACAHIYTLAHLRAHTRICANIHFEAYVHKCALLYKLTHVIDTHAHIHAQTCTYNAMNACIKTYIYTQIHTHTHTHARARAHTHTHKQTHTYTHKHSHTYTHLPHI